jgi:hypothetical protein
LSWEKGVLAVSIWVLFLGGLFGFAVGMYMFFSGKTVVEYSTVGIGAGGWLLAAAIVTYVRSKIS